VNSVNRAARSFLHVALALLVTAALARCSWEEACEVAQRTSLVAGHRLQLPSPVQKPVHDCDHESGCICRGATQVAIIDAAHCDAQPAELLAPPASCSVFWVDFGHSSQQSLDDCCFLARPISGRQLRAHLASLVI
jgi:hypothetical protein